MKRTDDLTPREIELKIKKTKGQYWKLYYTQGATPAILRTRPEETKDPNDQK